ncbi:hypothetical protein [Cytobacillus praedii]|uniref:hypothetical protein n=1 Tax=Cytobacillus praedii TaxID=1742358 RepID=UPI002E1A4E66|nr:hypothetical protein [Cytobacillus praedii]
MKNRLAYDIRVLLVLPLYSLNIQLAWLHLAGPVYQAGTLSGNLIAMSAGYKTLQLLEQPGVYDELEQKSARMEEGFRQNVDMTGVPLKINWVGSMLCPYFTKREVINFETAKQANYVFFSECYLYML